MTSGTAVRNEARVLLVGDIIEALSITAWTTQTALGDASLFLRLFGADRYFRWNNL